MSLSANTALDTLAGSAQDVADPRLDERLSHVHSLLSDDLMWVEQALGQAASGGTEPAASAARHLVARGGKRVRPTSVLLSAACFGQVPPAARELAVVVELVHTATLLHDDVIDDGMERRGTQAARRVWGNAISVLAGDTLLVHSLERTNQHAPELMAGLLSTLQNLVSGEIVQLRGRSRLDVSQTTYERILNDKTASLFRFATAAGARLAGARTEEQDALGEFGERVGIAFQLVDDVLDYVGKDTGKTLGVDLREGKITLPLVLAIQQNPRLIDSVRRVQEGSDEELLALRQLVATSGACEEVRQRAQRETRLATAALRGIRPSSARTLLTEVAEQLASRGK